MINTVMENSPVGFLVPAGTVVEESGQSAPLELGARAGKAILLVLRIGEVLEQESLHVSIWGSANGADWGTQALFWFPQKFHRGSTPAALNLGQRPDIKFLQARWETNRWGRGVPRPHFAFDIEVRETAA
jgi:hypothetical protein